MSRVTVEISGGVAELTEKPDGVEVVLLDFDNLKAGEEDGEYRGFINHYPEDGPLDHADCRCGIDVDQAVRDDYCVTCGQAESSMVGPILAKHDEHKADEAELRMSNALGAIHKLLKADALDDDEMLQAIRVAVEKAGYEFPTRA